MVKTLHKFQQFLKSTLKRPFISFFGLLGVIILLIIVGDILRKPPQTKDVIKIPKKVSIYSIGKAPKIKMTAKIEKTGTIKITALNGGIVQQIYKKEGDQVNRGTWLFSLSTNYQGASAPSISREIAQKNFQFLEENFDSQKELIGKNKEIAQNLETQATELREISKKSIDDSNSLINLNQDVISMIDQQITALEVINVNGASNSAILQLKSSKSAVLSGLNQARAALRATEYQQDNDQEPAKIARLQRDATIKQLEIQEKTLDLNKEIAHLNLRLSQISESLMNPASPFSGIIERIHVKTGQSVSPGTLLATLTANKNSANAVVLVSRDISQKISRLEPSVLYFNNNQINLLPSYLSTEPTDGSLYSVLYSLPEEFQNQLGNEQYITIDIPVGVAQSGSNIPFIPIDSVYQTEETAFIYLAKKNSQGNYQVESKKIKIGQVFGDYVEVLEGLAENDQIITNRNIIESDLIELIL